MNVFLNEQLCLTKQRHNKIIECDDLLAITRVLRLKLIFSFKANTTLPCYHNLERLGN